MITCVNVYFEIPNSYNALPLNVKISNLSLIIANSILINDITSLLSSAVAVILVIFADSIAAATTDALPIGIATA